MDFYVNRRHHLISLHWQNVSACAESEAFVSFLRPGESVTFQRCGFAFRIIKLCNRR
ncbi:hypothetical protein CIT292_10025 [Citrobacter youngae ATCC 29220]|uniref:Uncharacterized protein n=1 Tax=Citrobacter youngae ATCC 29220 TaxID=500640 RepID=D4BHL2_9ENTR|nr:hypothetical protein CIT292_10025 [Citrobacter youngae ATCC 29220]